MSDVIGRLLDDRAVVARVARAATGGRHVGGRVGAVEVDPIPATSMATGAVARVRGNLTFDHETTTWSVVLKVVHSPDRSPIWTQIPPEFHDITLAQIPWRAEPELYRSALPDLLPAGLRMPATYHVDEIDDGAMAIWMEDVAHVDGPWTLGDYRHAARLLGRLAGRFPESTSGAPLPLRRRDLRFYFTGRVGQAVLPALLNDAIWAHPLIAPVVDPGLRGDLHALAGMGLAILDQVDALPRTLAHCDACPQNLLRGVDGDVVAIDWQLSGWCAVGFDVGQLIAGHAQSGHLDPAQFDAAYTAAIEEYTGGLYDEGVDLAVDDVALGAAGAMIIRSAFTALPLEFLDLDPTPELVRLFERRARFARFLVDLAHTRFPFSRPRDAGVLPPRGVSDL